MVRTFSSALQPRRARPERARGVHAQGVKLAYRVVVTMVDCFTAKPSCFGMRCVLGAGCICRGVRGISLVTRGGRVRASIYPGRSDEDPNMCDVEPSTGASPGSVFSFTCHCQSAGTFSGEYL